MQKIGFKPEVSIVFTADVRLGTWVGLSIMGALTVTLSRSPVIEGVPIGAFVSREDHVEHGPGFPFSPACEGSIVVYEEAPSSPGLVGNDLASLPTIMPPGGRHSHPNSPGAGPQLPSPFSYSTSNMSVGKQDDLFQGWLVKQGGGSTMMSRKSWKRRWFILQGHQLSYHKSNTLTVSNSVTEVRNSSAGTIDLRGARAVEPWDGRRNGFCIFTRERIYYLQADTLEERARWIRKVRQAKVSGNGEGGLKGFVRRRGGGGYLGRVEPRSLDRGSLWLCYLSPCPASQPSHLTIMPTSPFQLPSNGEEEAATLERLTMPQAVDLAPSNTPPSNTIEGHKDSWPSSRKTSVAVSKATSHQSTRVTAGQHSIDSDASNLLGKRSPRGSGDSPQVSAFSAGWRTGRRARLFLRCGGAHAVR